MTFVFQDHVLGPTNLALRFADRNIAEGNQSRGIAFALVLVDDELGDTGAALERVSVIKVVFAFFDKSSAHAVGVVDLEGRQQADVERVGQEDGVVAGFAVQTAVIQVLIVQSRQFVFLVL